MWVWRRRDAEDHVYHPPIMQGDPSILQFSMGSRRCIYLSSPSRCRDMPVIFILSRFREFPHFSSIQSVRCVIPSTCIPQAIFRSSSTSVRAALRVGVSYILFVLLESPVKTDMLDLVKKMSVGRCVCKPCYLS